MGQWGVWQHLSFNWTTLRGKHCWHPIAIMGVVDTFGLGGFLYNKRATIRHRYASSHVMTDYNEIFFRKTLHCGSSVVNVINGRVPAHLVVLAYLLLDARTIAFYTCASSYSLKERTKCRNREERDRTPCTTTWPLFLWIEKQSLT